MNISTAKRTPISRSAIFPSSRLLRGKRIQDQM
jgi:hypothetical protein